MMRCKFCPQSVYQIPTYQNLIVYFVLRAKDTIADSLRNCSVLLRKIAHEQNTLQVSQREEGGYSSSVSPLTTKKSTHVCCVYTATQINQHVASFQGSRLNNNNTNSSPSFWGKNLGTRLINMLSLQSSSPGWHSLKPGPDWTRVIGSTPQIHYK